MFSQPLCHSLPYSLSCIAAILHVIYFLEYRCLVGEILAVCTVHLGSLVALLRPAPSKDNEGLRQSAQSSSPLLTPTPSITHAR